MMLTLRRACGLAALVMLSAMLLALAGCGDSSSSSGSIDGTWTIAMDETVKLMGDQLGTGPEKEMAVAMLKGMLKDMSIKIDTKAETMEGTMMGQTLPKTTIKLKSQDGNKFVVNVDGQDSTWVMNNGKLEITQDGQKLVLERK